MTKVRFDKGIEANLPTPGMAEDGHLYLSSDNGNMYLGMPNGSLLPLNRSPYYGTCSTASETNSKVVTLDTEVFSLYGGVMITVRFENANTASSPTINVNSTGAIAVKLYGTTAAGNTPAKSWNAGEAITFVYDGSYWLLVGGGEDNIGHLNTNNTTAQTPSASESFTSDINLHKVSKTGSYNDLNDTPVYALGESVGGPAKKAISIPFGQVDSTSTSTVFTATVDGITELRDGVCCYIRNGVVTSATGCTLNINGLGAKPMYYTTSSTGRVTSHFNINYTWLFVYNSTRIAGGCWDSYWGYNSEYNLSQNYIYIGRIDVGDYPTSAYSLGAFDVNGKWTPFVTTATTSTGKSLVPSVFPIGAKIYRDTASRSNNTSYNNVYLYTTLSNLDLRYSSVNHNMAIFPKNTFNRVFMPVIVNTQDNTFTLTTQTTSGYNNNFTNERNLNPNNFYIEVGFNSESSTSYYLTLICENNLYYYNGEKLIEYSVYKSSIIGHLKTDNSAALTPSTSESFTGDISLHKIAKTGSYNDLNDKPTIPSSDDFVKVYPIQGFYNNNSNWNLYLPGSFTNSHYVRITIPDSSLNKWTMLYFELSIMQRYSEGLCGKLYFFAMHNSTTGDWTYLKGTIAGNLRTSLTLYASDRKYLYIGGIYGYGSISIDKILCGDAIRLENLTSITIDTVTSLPSTYQTGEIFGAGSKITLDSNGLRLLDSMGDVLTTIQNTTAANTFIGSLPQWTDDPSDDVYLIRRDTGGSLSFGQVKFSTVWNYIKSKIASILGIGGSNGVPTAPTAAAGTNTTQIATTAFVDTAISNKADKVSGATNGNLAGLNGTGNLTDSGKKPADFATAAQGTKADTIYSNYLKAGNTIGTGTSNEFNPVNDSVHITPQSLGASQKAQVRTNIDAQETLVSGITLKTINNISLLGSGNINLSSSGGTVPEISTNIFSDKTSNTKTASPKAVYDEVHPAIVTTQPTNGFLPNVFYNLGTITGTVTFLMDTPNDTDIMNIYYWTFDTSTTAPTITWPAGITSWVGGNAPTVNVSKHYEVSVLNGIGVFTEV